MNLVIVESKSKIKTIEKILGKDFKVVASSGHIDNLPKKELGIDIENNFKPKYIIDMKKKKNIQDLVHQCQKASLVWLATDKDFEGERIAEALRKHCRLTKFNRVYFTEITPKAIQESFGCPVHHLHQGYLDCQETRRILDRLIGYKLSPILWKNFPMNSKKPISIGRVQAATLAIVMKRDTLIQKFETNKNWVVTGFFNDIQAILEPELTNEEKVVQVLKQLNGKFSSQCLDPKVVKSYPSKPFITSTLQQASYQQLGFPIQKTMKLAQELYEKGHITYLRTDSCILSNDFMTLASDYIKSHFGEDYLQIIPRVVKNNKNAQEAHEAIRPTRMNREINLSTEHEKLYSLIWNRSLGFLMTPALYQEIELQIRDSSFEKEMCFKHNIRHLMFPGYLVLDEKVKVVPTEQLKTESQRWKSINCHKIQAMEKFKNPPSHHDFSTLVKQMEKEGIGRPATYQASIDKLIDKKYIENKNFKGTQVDIQGYRWISSKVPLERISDTILLGKECNKLGVTELGESILRFLKQYFAFVVNIDFTKEMETHIDNILKESSNKLEILTHFYKTFQPLLSQTIEKPKQEVKVSTDLAQIKIGRKIFHIKEGPYGPYLHYKNDGKVKNISLTAYLQFVHKSLEQIKEKDIQLLLACPVEYKPGFVLEYGRYGFYSRQEKLSTDQIKNYLQLI